MLCFYEMISLHDFILKPLFINDDFYFQFSLQAASSVVSWYVLAVGLGRNRFGSSIFFDRNSASRGFHLTRLHFLRRPQNA